MKEKKIIFSPRKAWQIVWGHDFGALHVPTVPAVSGRYCPQNAEFEKLLGLLNKIRTYFKQNPQDFDD
jgi:hypothetical protein